MYATMARQHIIGSKIGGEPLDNRRSRVMRVLAVSAIASVVDDDH